MGRSVEKLACRPWARHEQIELVQGDVLDRQSLEKACRGCWAAYYLERLVLLSAMKAPGDALLEFQVSTMGAARSELQLISHFALPSRQSKS
jgi:hypothetical protein